MGRETTHKRLESNTHIQVNRLNEYGIVLLTEVYCYKR